MSCNGCRVLRKGCSDTCILRPCLQWIDTAEAQGHATLFVAKFFGRAGLMGFISAVPENQRSGLFQSLLYEACGRTVNPVFGAVGLLWSGNWQMCQAAVDTVLQGGSLRPPSPSSVLPPNLNYTCPPMSGNFTDMRVEDPTQMAFPSTASAAVSLGIGLPEPTAQEPNNNGWTREPNQLQYANTTEFRGEMQLPRRVRPRVDEECDHLELDLTLKVKGEKKKTAGTKRLSSPCDSVNSAGSVTSLDSAVQEPLGMSVMPQPYRQLLPLLQ